jgi:hypothetical protein
MIKRYTKYIHKSKDEDEELITIPQPKEEIHNEEISKEELPNEETEKKIIIGKERTIRYCNLCERKLISEKDYLLHIQGKKHLNKIKLATSIELKLFGSIRKYLKYKQLISKIKHSPLNKSRVILYTHLLKKMLRKFPINK